MGRDERRGHRRMGDITLAEVRAGHVWKWMAGDVVDEVDRPLQDVGPLAVSEDFTDGDWIVYSAVSVDGDGRVSPLILLHEFGGGYGGDYLEWIDGAGVRSASFPVRAS
jgi:hypothetical protein